MLSVRNRRRRWLRSMQLAVSVSGVRIDPVALEDLAPEATMQVELPVPAGLPGPARTVEGKLEFVTHHGIGCRVPVSVIAP